MNNIISTLKNLHKFLKLSQLNDEAEIVEDIVDVAGPAFRLNIPDFEGGTPDLDGPKPAQRAPLKYPIPEAWDKRFPKALKEKNYVVDSAESYINTLAGTQPVRADDITHTVKRFFNFDKNFKMGKIHPQNNLEPSEISDIYKHFASVKIKEIEKSSMHPERKAIARGNIITLWNAPVKLYNDMYHAKHWDVV